MRALKLALELPTISNFMVQQALHSMGMVICLSWMGTVTVSSDLVLTDIAALPHALDGVRHRIN